MKKQTKKKIIKTAKDAGNKIIQNIKNAPNPTWGIKKEDKKIREDILSALEGVPVSDAIQILKDCINLVEDNSVVGKINQQTLW